MDDLQQQRFTVLDHAVSRGWVLNPSKGMELFVETFLKLGHCPCDDKRAACPCSEADVEVPEKGKCRCGLYWASLQAFRKTLRPVKEEKDARRPTQKTGPTHSGRARKQNQRGTAGKAA